MPRTCSGVFHGRFYPSHCLSGTMPRTCSGVLHALRGSKTNVSDPGASPGHPTPTAMPVVETSATTPEQVRGLTAESVPNIIATLSHYGPTDSTEDPVFS
jgi:hypothetical protein